MPTLAATATSHTISPALAVLALLLLTVGYVVACWLWPLGPCRRSDGTGKRGAPIGRAFRICHRCDGTGRQLRIGRRLYNSTHRISPDKRH